LKSGLDKIKIFGVKEKSLKTCLSWHKMKMKILISFIEN